MITTAELHEAAQRQGLRFDQAEKDYVILCVLSGLARARPRRDAPITRWLEPVKADRNRTAEDWFVYLRPEHYDPKTGLTPPESMDCLIG